jgi:AcrR family transcriptional regulator
MTDDAAPPPPTLRDGYKDQTRHRILQAFAACLEEAPGEEISVRLIAERAGTSERTVHRHFPTRVDLLAEAGDWINQHVFRYVRTDSLDELPDAYRQVVQQFEEQPHLATAVAHSSVGRSLRAGFQAEVRAQIEEGVRAAAPESTAAERRRATAALRYLDNVLAWVTLREEFGMAADEIADTVGWLIRLVVRELRAPADEGKRT